MDADRRVLYQRICEFQFEEELGRRDFLTRLAKEQGWTRRFAEKAIAEYRRFAFLAVAAGHPVCPSEAVDEVWHMHLVYTRSYWQRFCRDVLGQPLHHEPSRGGPNELGKHRGMYADTLASYRRLFGEDPPADVWPSVDERFACRPQPVKLVTEDYWLVPRWKKLAASHALNKARRKLSARPVYLAASSCHWFRWSPCCRSRWRH